MATADQPLLEDIQDDLKEIDGELEYLNKTVQKIDKEKDDKVLLLYFILGISIINLGVSLLSILGT